MVRESPATSQKQKIHIGSRKNVYRFSLTLNKNKIDAADEGRESLGISQYDAMMEW